MGHVIGIETTYTGNPVSFNAAHGGTMKSVSVPITPTQDLHGYATPWPAGGGKNKLPNKILKENAYRMQLGIDNISDWIPLKAGTYKVSVGYASGVTGTSIFWKTPTESAHENSTITLSQDGTVHIWIFKDGLQTSDVLWWQCEAGSTATAYAPYENICPISGRTGLSVYVGPTTAQADATTYAVDWTSQAGTVYGGTLDVVTGVLTVDRVYALLNDSSAWYEVSGNPKYRYSTAFADRKKYNNSYDGLSACSYIQVNEIEYTNTGRWVSSSSNNFGIESSGLTLAQIQQDATDGKIAIVYELATPLTYQLTPKSITALIGQNYIWSSNNQTLTAVLTAPATGFAGWLIKCVTNGTPVEIPLKYMRAETYTVTPDQRMEWSAERDVTGVLHRETVQNLPPKIEFNTPLMTNSDINALNNIIKAAFTNYLQRNITIQFYDPERNEYWEWDCYMPDAKYHIRNADTVNNIINYEELRYAFIGY